MIVTEHEGEEGELVDRVVPDGARGADHTTGFPPPPVARRIPCAADVGLREVCDAKRFPEGGRSHALGVEELKESLQIAQDDDEEAGQQATTDRGAHDRGWTPGSMCYQVVDDAEGAGQGERESQHLHEIEGDRCGYPAQACKDGCHQVAKIVVADAEAGEPGIKGWELLAPQDAVEKSQLHRLLCGDDLRVVRFEDSPDDDTGGEDAFFDGDDSDVGAEPGDDWRQACALPWRLGGSATRCTRAVGGLRLAGFCGRLPPSPQPRQRSHDNQDEQNRLATVGGQSGDAGNPHNVGDDKNGQRFGKGVAAIRQAGKDAPCCRQGRKTKDFSDEPPDENVCHQCSSWAPARRGCNLC